MAKQSSRGQILEREYGFLVRVFVERDPITGKRKYVNQKVRTTRKKEAEQVLTAMLRKLDMGEMLIEPVRQTLQEYLEHWLETAAKPRLTRRTFNDYRSLMERYVYPTLAKKPLGKLTAVDLQNLYREMLKSKEEDGKGLKARTVIYTHRVLSSALKQAVKWRMLHSNVCQYVDLPKSVKPEMLALSQEQVETFLEASKSDRHYVFYALMLGTGLRPSEALALMWKDFNPITATLNIQRTLENVKGEISFKVPKTPRSRRSIKLPDNLVKLLLDHQATQIVKGVLIFPSIENTPLDERNVNKYFKACLIAAGLGKAETRKNKKGKEKTVNVSPYRLYDLRHTHATLLLKAGVHPKIVSERLGHASITLTLDTYSHVLPGMQDEAANKLDVMVAFHRGVSETRVAN
jgi:integrase